MTQIASQEDVDKILKAFYLVYNTLEDMDSWKGFIKMPSTLN